MALPVLEDGHLVVEESVGLALRDFEDAGGLLVEHEHLRAVDFLAGVSMSRGAEFDGQSSSGLIDILDGLNGRFLADQQAKAGFQIKLVKVDPLSACGACE